MSKKSEEKGKKINKSVSGGIQKVVVKFWGKGLVVSFLNTCIYLVWNFHWSLKHFKKFYQIHHLTNWRNHSHCKTFIFSLKTDPILTAQFCSFFLQKFNENVLQEKNHSKKKPKPSFASPFHSERISFLPFQPMLKRRIYKRINLCWCNLCSRPVAIDGFWSFLFGFRFPFAPPMKRRKMDWLLLMFIART